MPNGRNENPYDLRRAACPSPSQQVFPGSERPRGGHPSVLRLRPGVYRRRRRRPQRGASARHGPLHSSLPRLRRRVPGDRQDFLAPDCVRLRGARHRPGLRADLQGMWRRVPAPRAAGHHPLPDLHGGVSPLRAGVQRYIIIPGISASHTGVAWGVACDARHQPVRTGQANLASRGRTPPGGVKRRRLSKPPAPSPRPRAVPWPARSVRASTGANTRSTARYQVGGSAPSHACLTKHLSDTLSMTLWGT